MCREEMDLVTITILGLSGFIAKGEIKKGIFLYRNFLDFVAGLVGPETIPCSLSLSINGAYVSSALIIDDDLIVDVVRRDPALAKIIQDGRFKDANGNVDVLLGILYYHRDVRAFMSAPDEIKADRDFVMRAIDFDSNVILYGDVRFLFDREAVLKAVSNDAEIFIDHFLSHFWKDVDMVRAALKADHEGVLIREVYSSDTGMFRVLADTIDFVTRADYQTCKIIDASCHLKSASLSAMPGCSVRSRTPSADYQTCKIIDASCHLESARYY